MNVAKEEKKYIADIFENNITLIYMIVMFLVFPGFYTDKLFQIAEDKKNFFLFFTVLYLAVLVILMVYKTITNRIKRQFAKGTIEKIFCMILLAAICLSTYFALDRKEAIYGISNRKLGALVMLGCVIAYLGVHRYGKFNNLTIWSMLLGSGFIYLCGILCACNINFLYLKNQLRNPELHLTPIGNINFNTAYMCLMLPIVVVMFMLCKERFSQVVYGIVLYMGGLFSLFIKTESSVICMVAMFLILAYFAVEDRLWFERYMQMVSILMLAIVTIFVLLLLMPTQLYPFDGLGKFLLSEKMVLLEVIVWIAGIALFRWKGEVIRTLLFKHRNKIRNILAIFVVVGVVVGIIVNCIAEEYIEGTVWEKIKIVDDTFNRRGYIWIRTMREYRELSWKNKLFGSGLNCFANFINLHYRDEMIALRGAVFIDPHNSFLQMLVTMGILGVVGYFGLIFFVLYKAIRTYSDNKFQIVVILTLTTYLLQGMVNSDTVYTLPLLFIFLGLASGDMRQLSEQET